MKSVVALASKRVSPKAPQEPEKSVAELLKEFEKTPEGEEVRMAIEAMKVAAIGTPKQRPFYPFMTGGYYRLDD